MPSVAYDFQYVSQDCNRECPNGFTSGHGRLAAGAVPVAVLAALSSAVASPAESVPVACEIASIVDIASHVEVPVNAPALGQPKEPSPSIDTCFTIFNFNVQWLFRNL